MATRILDSGMYERNNFLNPDDLIFRRPIFYEESEGRIEIYNLFTFLSYKRPSRRVLEKLRQVLSDVIIKYFGRNTPNIDVWIEEKALNLRFVTKNRESMFSPPHFIRYVFSSVGERLPDFFVREYRILPVIEADYKFYVVLYAYNRGIEKSLENLDKILVYKYATMPNEEGDFYVKGLGTDNIRSPPKLIRNLVELLRSDEFLMHPDKASRFVVMLLKDLANVVDDIEDIRMIHSILSTINGIISGERVELEPIEKSIRILESILNRTQNSESIARLYALLRNLSKKIRLLRQIEELTVIRLTLKRLQSRALSRLALKKQNARAFNHYVLAGIVLRQCKKKLINLGSGKAIYISSSEWKRLENELQIRDDAELEVRIVKRYDGTYSIVLDLAS